MIFMVLLFFKKIWAFWVKIQKAQIFIKQFPVFLPLRSHSSPP